MGNKPGAGERRLSGPAGASDHADGDQEAAAVAAVQEALCAVPESAPVMAQKQRFGGLMKKREVEGDAVEGLRNEAVQDVVRVLTEKSRLQTSMLLAKQKHIHKALQNASAKALAGKNRLQYVSEDMSSQANLSAQAAPALSVEVTRACDQLFSTIEALSNLQAKLNRLLPAQDQIEPFKVDFSPSSSSSS